LKGDSQRVVVRPRRTQPNNTIWGGLQTPVARVASVTQESRIGIDELAVINLAGSEKIDTARR
jgi:hypothetical protein